jgi:rod shape-determining protein MreD
VRRALLATAAVLAAILLQVTVLNNLPFPGGSPPNLVLVVVVAMALASGPLDGAVIGFAAGLAVDIAPPATDLVGQSALVFCLVGYGCGKLRGTLERSAFLPVAAVALGAAAGEALYALVGLTFGDPDITLHAVRQVLPVAVLYDVLLSPFVLYAVARLGGYAQWGIDTGGMLTGQELRPAGAGALGIAGAAGAVRDTGTGRSPRLRAAAAHRTDGWIGGGQVKAGQAGAWVDRPRPLRLRLRGGVAGSAAGGQPARTGPGRLFPEVNLRLAAPRRRDGVIATRRGVSGAAFTNGRGLAGSSSRLRGASLAGGPSALSQQGNGRKQRTARLKLGSKRHRDAVVGGGKLASGTWSGGPPRGARIGRGSFGGTSTPGMARTSSATFLARRQPGAPGPLRSGRGAGATPRFRRPSSRAPRSTTRAAAPKFRRPSTRLRRSTGGLGGGATPRFRRPAARLRSAGRGLLGWRPAGRRKGRLSIKGRGGPR